MASRLAAGESPRRIARETNQRPEAFQQLLKSEEFLLVLEDMDRDLADDIRQEREQAKPKEYEENVIKEAAHSVERLAAIRDFGDSETAQVAAAKAIIDIAEKVKKAHVGEKARRTSFPERQLKSLLAAAREVDEMEKRVRESAGTARSAER